MSSSLFGGLKLTLKWETLDNLKVLRRALDVWCGCFGRVKYITYASVQSRNFWASVDTKEQSSCCKLEAFGGCLGVFKGSKMRLVLLGYFTPSVLLINKY